MDCLACRSAGQQAQANVAGVPIEIAWFEDSSRIRIRMNYVISLHVVGWAGVVRCFASMSYVRPTCVGPREGEAPAAFGWVALEAPRK